MEINHRICTLNNEQFKKEIDKLEIKYEYTSDIKSIVLNINESDKLWDKIEKLIKKYKLLDFVTPKFSKEEIDEADWFRLETKGHFGYPQPEDGYIELSYNTINYCERCGRGLLQKAPIRFKNFPKKHSHFFQLNWIFDEFFINKEVKIIFEKNNINDVEYINPIIHKSNEKILDYYQLKINKILNPGLHNKFLKSEICSIDKSENKIKDEAWMYRYPKNYPACNEIKYNYPERDFITFNKDIFNTSSEIVKSFEYFGSGGESHKLIIVSKRIKKIIEKNKFRGIEFYPIKTL